MSVKEHHIQTQILEACTGKDLLTSDRISDLPDDILVRVLSLLTLKEAGATSVLSKRWTHVWSYLHSLDFDFDDFDARKLMNTYTHTVSETKRNELECKYVSWVNQVVRSHKAVAIDEFNVRYCLDNSHKDDIDNWLRFAMEKRVKWLQLNLHHRARDVLRYTFPCSLSSWNRLTSLQLRSVDISGEFLDKILCDCQTLEFLSILNIRTVKVLKIVGPNFNLKHLAIKYCGGLKEVEIFAPNLISFHYLGRKLLCSPFKSTPKLSKVMIGGGYACALLSDFSDLSSCMSHIEELTLHPNSVIEEREIMKEYPVGSRLQILLISVDEPLFCLSSLIKACPFLHKLVIEIILCYSDVAGTMSRKKIKSEWFRHKHLKILEIGGFGGSVLEMRFAKHLIRCAASLEKVIIQTGHCLHERGKQIAIQGREQAKLLAAILKSGIELQVLGDEDEGSRPSWRCFKR